jgi:hypothetical protein
MKLRVVAVHIEHVVKAELENYLEFVHYALAAANKFASESDNEEQLADKLKLELAKFGSFDYRLFDSEDPEIAIEYADDVVLRIDSSNRPLYLN